MSNIREKVQARIQLTLNDIEQRVRRQEHLTNSEPILDLLSDVEGLWSFLDEDDREFIGAVRFAVRTKVRWD